jgi:sulfite reductase (NADPH) flavoprotein alpha-component
MNENTRITAPGYERDTRHYEFDISGTGMEYDVGDVLATYPHNLGNEVDDFLASIKLDGNQAFEIERLSENVSAMPE